MVDSDIYPCEPVGTEFADFVLPAATWGEDDLTRCNSERRLRLYSQVLRRAGRSQARLVGGREIRRQDGLHGRRQLQLEVVERCLRGSGPLRTRRRAQLPAAGRQGQGNGRQGPRAAAHAWAPPASRRRFACATASWSARKRLHDPSNNWGEMESSEVQRRFLYAFNTHYRQGHPAQEPVEVRRLVSVLRGREAACREERDLGHQRPHQRDLAVRFRRPPQAPPQPALAGQLHHHPSRTMRRSAASNRATGSRSSTTRCMCRPASRRACSMPT